MESFPLDFASLSNLTLRGEDGQERTILDAAFTSDVMRLESGMTVEGVTLTHGAFGLVADGTTEVTIRRNRMTANSHHGMLLRGAGASASITENLSELNGLDGISINLGFDATITDNTLRDNDDEGIEVIDAMATLRHNLMTSNRSDGVVVSNGSVAELTENTILDNGDTSINDGGGVWIDNQSMAILTSNTILNNANDGVRIIEMGTSGILTNNIIGLNKLNGIDILEGASATITGGTISGNERHGLFLLGNSKADIALSGEMLSVTDQGRTGIFITDDGSLARIDLTRISLANNADGDIVGPFVEP